MESRVRFQKILNGFSPMPTSSIDIKPDGISLQSSVQMTKDVEKPLAVSPLCVNHPIATQQRGYPAGNVEALAMLTGGSDAQTAASLSPPPTQSGVQGKTGLVLKDHRLSFSQRLKFFLKPAGISSPLWPSLASKSSWPASGGIPGNASTSELVLLLRLPRNVALDASPLWDHPTELDSSQTLGATSPNGPPKLSGSLALFDWVAQTSAWTLMQPILRRLQRGSIDLGSCGSSPRPRLSILVADLPGPKAKRLSLCPSTLLVSARLMLKDALSWPLNELTSMSDFACNPINILTSDCHFI